MPATKSRTKAPKKSNADVYQEITDAILAKLAEGVAPWRMQWDASKGLPAGLQRNFSSGRPYRGINQFLLAMSPYASPYWLTYKGAKAAGGQVRKGEKSTTVILWKFLKVEDKDPKTGEVKTKTIPMLRTFSVFNIEQVDGLDLSKLEADPEADPFDPIAAGQAIMDGYADGPSMTYGGSSAYYQPSTDAVRLPEPETFRSREAFYSVAFHEMAHSTGHESRLARKGITEGDGFGSESYSQEELVAEMTAAMLCAVAGISQPVIDNQAAYVANWLQVLENDPKMVVIAGAQAQKAADRILGVSFSEEA